MAEYSREQRKQESRTIGNCGARRRQLNDNNNDSLARIIQCMPPKKPFPLKPSLFKPKLSPLKPSLFNPNPSLKPKPSPLMPSSIMPPLPPLIVPQTETKDDFRARYPNSGFASNLATAINWGRNIGGQWAITGSMAVALHTLNSNTPGKVIPVDDLDIIDANRLGSLSKADSETMKPYYEVSDIDDRNSEIYVGDKVEKTSIDVLRAGRLFGDIGETVMIYGLPVVSIASLIGKYKSSSRGKDILKIDVLNKM